ncbi:Hypothetical protein D9617_7g030100 [Elsinoe fawcettii]|nr:Hypothetical protein D9617_7g030100 [Elsinoe fawcettii]
MHITLVTTLTSSVLVIATPFSFGDPAHMLCTWKNPQLVQAIDQFCSNSKIVVPSAYGADGKTVGDNLAWVWPQGKCPEAWVPRKYCNSQFYRICAKGDKKGYGKGFFGRPGESACQVWLLDSKKVHDQHIRWRDNGGPPSRGQPPTNPP